MSECERHGNRYCVMCGDAETISMQRARIADLEAQLAAMTTRATEAEHALALFKRGDDDASEYAHVTILRGELNRERAAHAETRAQAAEMREALVSQQRECARVAEDAHATADLYAAVQNQGTILTNFIILFDAAVATLRKPSAIMTILRVSDVWAEACQRTVEEARTSLACARAALSPAPAKDAPTKEKP